MKEHRIKDEEKEEKPMFEEPLTVAVETQRLKVGYQVCIKSAELSKIPLLLLESHDAQTLNC